jgi:hypothetical protein
MMFKAIAALFLIFGLVCHAETVGRGGNSSTNEPSSSRNSPEQLWAEQLCKEYSSNIKKFGDCIDWEKSSSMADRMWADGQCGGNKAYEKDSQKFEKCAEAKQTENRFKRIKAADNCGGFEAFNKDATAFRKCRDAEFKRVKYPPK